jgi:nucleotide-binding universal stress UspA family protein
MEPYGQAEGGELHLGTTRLRLNKILVATDFSRHSRNAQHLASELAAYFNSKLLLVHSVTPVALTADTLISVPEYPLLRSDVARTRLQQEAQECTAANHVQHEEIVEARPLIELINEVVEQERVGLIVAGSHGASGIEKLALGSVAESILRRTDCPVMVTGPHYKPGKWQCRSIVFATDFSSDAFRPAQYAAALAEEMNAELTLLHLAPPHRNGEAEEVVREGLQSRLWELLPEDVEDWCRVKTRVEFSEDTRQVTRLAEVENADLILLGVAEKGPLADHAPWGTLTSTIQHAKCPVMAVRGHLHGVERRRL